MTLDIVAVDKWFTATRGMPSQHILRSISLTVQTGEFVTLIGPTGCGKSTLLNVVAGLETPSSGDVMLNGTHVGPPGPDRAIVFQNYSLLPRLSLEGNVRAAVLAARPDWPRSKAHHQAERYLRAVGLWDHRNKRPGEVSGGMQQRTAVARAFAVEPRLLLLDEPFGALDALTRARLQHQLTELWQSESRTETVMMVTHGIEEAIYLADRIVVMSMGPGPSILDEFRVPLERPRHRATVINEPAYQRVYRSLLEALNRESASLS